MYGFMFQWVKDNIKKQDGQTMAEYGIILAVIAVAVVGTLILLNGQIKNTFSNVIDSLTGTDPNAPASTNP